MPVLVRGLYSEHQVASTFLFCFVSKVLLKANAMCFLTGVSSLGIRSVQDAVLHRVLKDDRT